MDGAAEAKPRKEGVLIDDSLSPVPEAVGSVCSASKATQTHPEPPASPPPSTTEKVRLSNKTYCEEIRAHKGITLQGKILVTNCTTRKTFMIKRCSARFIGFAKLFWFLFGFHSFTVGEIFSATH